MVEEMLQEIELLDVRRLPCLLPGDKTALDGGIEVEIQDGHDRPNRQHLLALEAAQSGRQYFLNMVEVHTDTVRNVVRLAFSQVVEEAQTRRCRGEIETLLEKVQPGFRLLTDLSGLESMDIACATDIRAIMDLCQCKGVAQVVRIIPDPHKDIGFKLMSFFHYAHEIPMITCTTLAEALERLA
jgi:hypothetical protein